MCCAATNNNPETNAAAFIDGGFRTGDIGAIDEDGHLALTGRIKELINRGGEKISPEEVEAVLLEHPAVAQAAVFGVPDPKYGEKAAAAVVLKNAATEIELQRFCRAHLADFKMPEVIHLVSAIPKNAMAKVQRYALAQRFKESGAVGLARSSSLCVEQMEEAEKLLPHNSSVIALTLRVETPCTYISANAATNARSERW